MEHQKSGFSILLQAGVWILRLAGGFPRFLLHRISSQHMPDQPVQEESLQGSWQATSANWQH